MRSRVARLPGEGEGGQDRLRLVLWFFFSFWGRLVMCGFLGAGELLEFGVSVSASSVTLARPPDLEGWDGQMTDHVAK